MQEHDFKAQFRHLTPAVQDKDAGKRLDLYLAKNYQFLTRAGWQKRLDLGEVLINRSVAKASYKLRDGDNIHFFHPLEVEPEVDHNLRVLWQDGAVMAVFKPGNLPMHENGAYRKNTFAHFLSKLVGDQWSAVHRLDRETSGIVLCGANHAVRQALSLDFENKKISKEYLMIVNGIPKEPQWTNTGPLGDLKESQIRIKKWVVEGGLSAETMFSVEATSLKNYALLRAFPRTGRTNQIRIHAAHSGHWILGDKLYHPNEEVFLDYWKTGLTTEFAISETKFSRCCLHAAALSFKHPETNQHVRIESPLPEDMQDLWCNLSS